MSIVIISMVKMSEKKKTPEVRILDSTLSDDERTKD